MKKSLNIPTNIQEKIRYFTIILQGISKGKIAIKDKFLFIIEFNWYEAVKNSNGYKTLNQQSKTLALKDLYKCLYITPLG